MTRTFGCPNGKDVNGLSANAGVDNAGPAVSTAEREPDQGNYVLAAHSHDDVRTPYRRLCVHRPRVVFSCEALGMIGSVSECLGLW